MFNFVISFVVFCVFIFHAANFISRQCSEKLGHDAMAYCDDNAMKNNEYAYGYSKLRSDGMTISNGSDMPSDFKVPKTISSTRKQTPNNFPSVVQAGNVHKTSGVPSSTSKKSSSITNKNHGTALPSTKKTTGPASTVKTSSAVKNGAVNGATTGM